MSKRMKVSCKVLSSAVKDGNVQEIVNLLSEGVEINSTVDNEDGPLHIAIKQSACCDIIGLLLDAGADVTRKSKEGELPLMLAIEKRNVEAIILLLDHSADVYVIDSNGSTPLHRAAILGLDIVVELLLQKQLFVDIEDAQHYTALHHASKEGQESVVKLLLAYGANLKEADRNGRTAMQHAAMGGHYEIVCRLIDYGGNVNHKDNHGRTCLHDAAWLGYTDIVQTLLNCSADMKAADNEGFTALHHAAMRGHVDVICILLGRGADLSIQDKSGRTPLHHVILRGNYEMIKMLIECSDDLDTPDNENFTPLASILCGMYSTTISSIEKHPELAELLIRHTVRITMMNSDPTVGAEDLEGLKPHLSETRWNEMCLYYSECVDEINKIRQYKTSDDSISLYDFLMKKPSTLVKYAQNSDAVNVLDSSKWVKQFPIYSEFLKARANKAVGKRNLLLFGSRCLSMIVDQSLPYKKGLPFIPSEMILNRMNDLDLENLIKACYWGSGE